MDRTGYERSELQIFCYNNVLLRSYGSFNVLVLLYYLELPTSAEKLQKQSELFCSQTH